MEFAAPGAGTSKGRGAAESLEGFPRDPWPLEFLHSTDNAQALVLCQRQKRKFQRLGAPWKALRAFSGPRPLELPDASSAGAARSLEQSSD